MTYPKSVQTELSPRWWGEEREKLVVRTTGIGTACSGARSPWPQSIRKLADDHQCWTARAAEPCQCRGAIASAALVAIGSHVDERVRSQPGNIVSVCELLSPAD